jgi:hypothetical protein
VGKLKGSRPLGRPRRRSEDNIKMDFRGCGIVVTRTGSICLGKEHVAGCCKCGNEPSGFTKCRLFV